MNVVSRTPKTLLMLAMLASTASVSAAAQAQESTDAPLSVNVTDTSPPEATPSTRGPQLEGIISGRDEERVRVTAADGTSTIVTVNSATQIRAKGGFLGLNRSKLAADSLMNGLPVTVRTLQSANGLLASQIDLKNQDLKTASMIRNGTSQGFAEQTAATGALRSRVADIGQYNVKTTTNVNFDTGKAALSPQAENDLCATASAAEGMKNALLLVVGYTDSTGDSEFNQRLSEKRAARVVNYLQQNCGWKPYRMLTPTGMSEAQPFTDNDTPEGRAQNRRVAVNVLVSKGLDGL
ncbi:OmpA family protein [Sphingobium subterraneum]|uniref:Outer membrane protein OmpA-like peptidoglycan-associated protein n=1 Tax=Sphingobium subterraneum TaxID=627688 RepID=A0A841IWN7_9SPHN|nr:OmpA family protein [Sphingobium subterraneum]MBB6123349.1 outer membrane protein OmpA-like peptidoglycan-associated protein [Sphingobium subterraneum]